MESLTTDEAEAWVRILTEQKNRVQNETTENDSLATTYFKLALVMYVLALGALVYLKYFGSFSFGEEKVDPKAKRGGRATFRHITSVLIACFVPSRSSAPS